MTTLTLSVAQGKETPIQQTLDQVRLMYRYALEESRLDDGARAALADVKWILAVPDEASPDPGTIATAIDFDKLMAAHAALARVIAPATPSSLEATEPMRGWFGSLRKPPLIKWMVLLAPVLLACFAGAGAFSSLANFPKLVGPNSPNLLAWLEWASAAGLGAVFYVLFTAHNYVKDRTFDPRYNAVYVIRFVLGVLAGIILAIVISYNNQLRSSPELKQLVPDVIALLGGFSAEAVYQILQRMVDVLVVAVRGDGADAAKTKAEQTAQTQLLNLTEDAPPELKSKLIAAVKKIAA